MNKIIISVMILAGCATTKEKSYTYEELMDKATDKFLACASDLESYEFKPVMHVIRDLPEGSKAVRDAIEWYLRSCTTERLLLELEPKK